MDDAAPRLARYTGVAPGAAIFVVTAVATTALAAANGGYFWSSWSWACLALSACAIAGLVSTSHRPGTLGVAYFAFLLAFAGWTLTSLAWAPSGAPVFEAERVLVYVTGAAAALVTVRRSSTSVLFGGVLCGLALVDLYALGTRLLPDKLGSSDALAANRLAAPVGYWNGLGITAVMGALLALGFAVRGRTSAGRAAAALTLPVFLPTLYFTFSRGSWLALFIGVVLLVAVDARRLQLITVSAAVLVFPLVALLLAWHAHALGRAGGASAAAVVHDGHRLAWLVVLLAIASACVATGAQVLAPRIGASSSVRRAYAGALIAVTIAGLVAAFAVAGNPVSLARRGWHSFTGPPTAVGQGQQENSRLLSLSSNGRIELWHVAWHEAQAHPLAGGGAGTYESWWLAHRGSTLQVRDAHSLYLQTLAETGAIGLLLLVSALVMPIVGVFRSRRRPVIPFALAAYVAFLVHAAGDWDWQLAGVTLPAILIGAGLAISGRNEAVTRAASARVRTVALGAACVALAVSFLMVLGNVPLTRASSAADAARWADSAREARKAERWLPWASEPWRFAGEADLALRDRTGARRALETALEKDPRNWQLWFDLSAATKGKDSKRALAHAARLNPRSPEIEQLRKFPG